MITFIFKVIFESIIAFLIGTIIFDFIHYSFHRMLKSKSRVLKFIGSIHSPHHHFFPASLKIQKERARKNLLFHVTFEYAVQALSILTCIFFLEPIAVLLAEILQLSIFIYVLIHRGVDLHHYSRKTLKSPRGGMFVDANYHAMHHVYPNQFFSSYIKVFDCLFGTAHHLVGKRIAMTGANGALGQHLKKLLEKEGAIIVTFKYGLDYTYEDYTKLKEPLAKTDILILCHGSKHDFAQQANCDSFVSIIELFKTVRQRDLLPIEIWGTGSEIECHPYFGIKKLKAYALSKRNYAKRAKIYYHDQEILYRHLVHSAFISRMGPGLMTASFAAKVTLLLIKRGFKYVPVSYTGFAFLNYFRFYFSF